MESQNYRVLPRSEHFFFAVDADFFKPVFLGESNQNYYKYDFYHGNGFWMDLRSEFKANTDFAIDFKASVVHGTSSNGPTYLAVIIPRVGITYRQHGFLGFDWETRLSDINRQTVGIGVFIEDKDTDGGYAIAKLGDFTAKLMVDGTGSFKLDGGVVALDASMWNGLIGATVFLNETETSFHAPQFIGTLYSKHDWNNGLGCGAETGGDEVAKVAMAYVQFKNNIDHFHFFVKPQFRYYGKGILGTLPKNVEQVYVSYDQNDKPYTNLMDIFTYGDNVETYSAQINLEYIFNIFYRTYIESEFVDFRFHDRPEVQLNFFRAGFKFYPFKDREDEFGIMVGNKFLIASTTQSQFSQSTRTYSSPDNPDFENKPLFMKQLYFMFNFSAHIWTKWIEAL